MYDNAQLVVVVVTILYIILFWKIAYRFRRSPLWSFLVLIPVIGHTIFWIMMAVQKVAVAKEGDA